MSMGLRHKFSVVRCESVNLIGYMTIFYLLRENSYRVIEHVILFLQ